MRVQSPLLARSWSWSIQLPQSDFVKPLPAVEQALQLSTCTDHLYAWQRRRRSAEKLFVLHDGPPYANGPLHIGHALNKLLKDMICRTELLQGKKVHYVPGWDCHGLPIELKALQQAQGTREELPSDIVAMNPVTVREAARRLASQAIIEQRRTLQGWGIMADWAGAWTTMDPTFEREQLAVFRDMLRHGLIYRQFKPVYWSPGSGTALAEAELEYREQHESTTAFVKFALVDIPHELATAPGVRSSDLAALIWTTTPWTLPANEAIAVHAEILYAVMESASHGQLLVAESQIPSVVATCFDAPPRLVKGSIPGRILAGRTTYRHPLRRTGSKPQPIIHADFVSDGSGSGLVHCAPGHGMEDYEVCRRHGLPVTSPVDDQGRFVRDELLSQPDRLQGRDVLSDGSQHALEWLREREAVVKTDVIRHKYPYDWRSRRPVIVRATEQWFANVDRIKGAATKSLDAVRFLPPSGRARLESFLAGRSEWCISRQRAWGVPIPALYHEQRGEALMTPESVSHVISVIEQRGIDAWWSDPDDDPAWTPPECREASGATGYRRGKDTLDVWFDSGTSWTQMKHMPIAGREALADVYLEGTDQHRGWFQSSLLTYTAHQRPTSAAADAVPELPLFKKLVTHGFTLDAAGRKMSKSVGNVVSPAEIMAGILLSSSKKKGPDQEVRPIPGRGAQWLDLATLRVWVASSDYTKDVAISQQSLTAIRESTRKIGLTLKWLLGVLSDFDPSRAVPYSELSELDRMALLQLAHVNEKVFELFKTYEFYKAMPVISSWLNADLSAFYFDLIKDRLYCDEKQGLDRQRAQTVLLHIFNHLLGLLAPIVPHLVERAWRRTPAAISETKEHPLHRVYPSVPPEWLNPDLASELPRLLEAKAAVNTALELARREGKLQQSIESIIALTFSDRAAGEPCKGYALFERYKDELAELFVVAGVHLVRSSKPSDASDPTSEQEQATPTSQTSSTVYEHSNNQPDKAVELSSRTFQTIDNESVTVQVFRSSMEKCHRCWKHTAWRPASAPTDQSQSAESEIDVLCRRCQDVVDHWRQSKPAEFQAAFAASAPTSPVPTL